MSLINHYSMLWGGVLILVLAAYTLLRKGFQPKRGLVLVVLGAALVAAYLFLRPDQASTTEMSAFRAELGSGQAVLLELQSPY